MRETLLDLMIRFNNENMLDPWNENEEELDDLDDLLGSYRRGTLGSYQGGSVASAGNLGPPVDPAAGAAPAAAPPAAPAVPFTPPAGYKTTPSEIEGFFQGLSKPGSSMTDPSWSTGGFGTLQSWEQQDAPTGFDPGVMGTTPGGTPYYSYSKTRPGAAGGAGGAGGGGGSPEGTAGYLADYGKGLMEPGSDLSKRWMEQMREDVGKGTDAAQRAAGYQAAQSGFGSGASPELLQMQGDIGIAGREAAGDAASDYLLRAPELGIGAMGGALGSMVGMRGQDLGSKTESERNKLAREGMQFQEKQAQGYEDTRQRERAEDIAYQKKLDDEEQRRWALANQFVEEGSTGDDAYSGSAYQQPSFGGWSLSAR